MGSPVVPLMANAFMYIIEERLQDQGKMPNFYKRYVDDTFSVMRNVEIGEAFLSTLNDSHPLISFTMELATNGKLSLSGGVNRETHVPPGDKGAGIKSRQILNYYCIIKVVSMGDIKSHC